MIKYIDRFSENLERCNSGAGIFKVKVGGTFHTNEMGHAFVHLQVDLELEMLSVEERIFGRLIRSQNGAAKDM